MNIALVIELSLRCACNRYLCGHPVARQAQHGPPYASHSGWFEDLSAGGLGARRIVRLDLRARGAGKMLAEARHTDIVLVQKFALARIIGHGGQHLAVLFEHRPVPLLKDRRVEEVPGFAGEARDLARAPEEHAA